MWRDHTILVTPVDSGGWSVRFDESQPLMFLSGARAEEQARALARCLARAGQESQVVVHDRTRAIVGATRYVAAQRVVEAA